MNKDLLNKTKELNWQIFLIQQLLDVTQYYISSKIEKGEFPKSVFYLIEILDEQVSKIRLI